MNTDIFSKSEWIWYRKEPIPDSYGDFKDTFFYESGQVLCRLSCDGEYTFFVNGTYVSSNQYADYEHYKVYDQVDITGFLKQGENEIYILVWHMGVPSQRYCPGEAGLLYEVVQKEKVLACSDCSTLSRQNPHYLSGYCKSVSLQLGCSFLYDASKEEDTEYTSSVIVTKLCSMYERPIEKLVLQPEKQVEYLISEPCHYLIDCGEEVLGVPVLKFTSGCAQKILVAWGEHIKDGGVRRKIQMRDFSFEYIAQKGYNEYINYMLRLGMRYLEVFTEAPVDIEYIGVLPQQYPVTVRPAQFADPLDQKIYDVCVRTLQCCMMEHYMDTPWREQCLYAFDSRNQMLAGYQVFENGNRAYARANLELMAKAPAREGLLPMTHPSGKSTIIPSFSLHYITAVREYLDFTGDLAFGEQVYDRMYSVIETFAATMKDGLLRQFAGEHLWNFYDWTPGMNHPIPVEEGHTDLMINCLFLLALKNMEQIARKLGRAFTCKGWERTVKRAAHEAFYHREKGIYSMTEGGEVFTELGNALAILSGLAKVQEYDRLEEALLGDWMEECTLSTKCFKYDALLLLNDKNRAAVTKEIRRTYGQMLEEDATTVWEVIGGADDFSMAGSLCHGWSALPVCYLKQTV